MTRLLVGVVGHVDHGKSALVRALTGRDTDRLPEEKRRGISIALGFAHLRVEPDVDIDLLDMPGHEQFVRTMIAGATGIDALLLVVAANEGIRAQTIEHVDIARLLGQRRGVIAVTKTDLVTPDVAARVAADAQQLLARAGFEPPAVVMTSAVRGEGIGELGKALCVLAASAHVRTTDGICYLPIDRAFSIAGHGPVVTGTLRGAPISSGDTLEVWPARRRVRVRAVQVHGEPVVAALPGQRVALNLRDIDTADLRHGMVVAAPDTLEPSGWLTIAIRTVDSAPPLKNGIQLRGLLGTQETDIRLRLLDREVLEAGENGFAQLHLAAPVAIPAGEHVVLRLPSPARTVAGGRVLEPVTRRLRRNAPSVLARLEKLRDLSPEALVAAEAEREASGKVTLQSLSQLSSLSVARIGELLAALPVVVTRKGIVLRRAEVEALMARIPLLLAAQAAGLSGNNLRSLLPGTAAALLDEALGELLARSVIVRRGSQFLVPRPDEDRARARNEAELTATLAAMLREAGLTPPVPGAIVTDAPTKRAVDRLLREGVIVRTVDRAKGKELLFHRDVIAEAQHRLAPLLDSGPGLLVTEIAAALGISRKFCMPLLDHLDSIGFTRRVADRRQRGSRR